MSIFYALFSKKGVHEVRINDLLVAEGKGGGGGPCNNLLHYFREMITTRDDNNTTRHRSTSWIILSVHYVSIIVAIQRKYTD